MPTTLALYQLVVVAINLQQAESLSDFGDLGRKLFAGFVVGAVFAVLLALIKIRQRDKHPPTKFISIIPSAETDKAAPAAHE